MQSKNKKENTGITALYCRLSRDDGTESEEQLNRQPKEIVISKGKGIGAYQHQALL